MIYDPYYPHIITKNGEQRIIHYNEYILSYIIEEDLQTKEQKIIEAWDLSRFKNIKEIYMLGF